MRQMRGLYLGDGKKYENSMSKGKRVKYGPAMDQLATFFVQFRLANNWNEGLCKRALTQVTFKFDLIKLTPVMKIYIIQSYTVFFFR